MMMMMIINVLDDGKTQMNGAEIQMEKQIQSGAGIGGRNALQIVFGPCFGSVDDSVSLCND